MTHPERVEDYLEHIADAIARAMRYVGDLENLQALEQNQQAQDAVVRTIAVIGEATNRIWRKPHSGASAMTPTCRVRRSISPRTLRAT
jgi:uncharacterized protein with HEPN domain